MDELSAALDLADPWAQAIAAWMLVLTAAGQRRSTRALRAWQLRHFAEAMRPAGPWTITGADIVAWVGANDWERETLRSWRAALRGFYSWAVEAGHVEANPALSLPKVKPAEPNPRPTPEDAYRDALTRSDERVRLMIRLGGALGMRRGEVAVARREDLVREVDGWTLHVHGKGGKTRRVPVPDGLAATIRSYRAAGYLFPGEIDGHLSPAWVGRLVARALPGPWAMHSLRHRFGTAAHEIERDLVVVQELLGHASIDTTRRYVRVTAPRLRSTVNAVEAL